MADSTKQNTNADRQYIDDLEYARALSLESLALDHFRQLKLQENQKQPTQSAQVTNSQKHGDAKASERKNSMPQPLSSSTTDRMEFKPRPRPGSFNTGAPRPSQILAPPPQTASRRVSAGATCGTSNADNDLISFSSPDSDKKPALNLGLEDLYSSFSTSSDIGSPGLSKDEPVTSSRLNRSNSSVGTFGYAHQAIAGFRSQHTVSLDSTAATAVLPHSQSDSSTMRSANYAAYNLPDNNNASSLSNRSVTNSAYMPQWRSIPTAQYGMNNLNVSHSAPFLSSSANYPFYPLSASDNLKPSSSVATFGISNIPSPVPQGLPFRTYEMRLKQNMVSTDSGLRTAGSSTMSQASQAPLPVTIQSIEYVNSADTGLQVLKVIEKKDNSNLIDLSLFENQANNNLRHEDSLKPYSATMVRTSVLEAFDPLLISSGGSSQHAIQEQPSEGDDAGSQCSGSLYDPYDPFDFMYTPSEGSQSDPVYAAVVKKKDRLGVTDAAGSGAISPDCTKPPPLPPRNYVKKTEEKQINRQKSFLHEDITETKCNHNCDLKAFHQMLLALREEHPYTDPYTNIGLVTSPTISSTYMEGTSIKLIVHSMKDKDAQPVTFTCDVTSTVEHVILHVICELEGDIPGEASDYVLQVWGLAEYLTPNTTLSDYEYVHNCIKLDEDVTLAVMHMDEVNRPLARTLQDDNRDKAITVEGLLTNDPVTPISLNSLQILLGTLESEIRRLQQMSLHGQLQPKGVEQAVKAVCALLGNIETSEITKAVDGLMNLCSQYSVTTHTSPPVASDVESAYCTEIGGDDGCYSVVTLRRKVNQESKCDSTLADAVANQCERLRGAVVHLIDTYSQSFRVKLQFGPLSPGPSDTQCVSSVHEYLILRIDGLHRLQANWEHDEYLVAGQVYHGTRPYGQPVLSRAVPAHTKFYKRVIFDGWLMFDNLSINMLPREARLVLVLYGRTLTKQPDGNIEHDNVDGSPKVSQVELGWVSLQFFDYDGVLTHGSFLLSLWPPAADKRLGPAPLPGAHPYSDTHPVLGIEIPDFGSTVQFPALPKHVPKAPTYDFDSLDQNTQQQLLDIISQDTFTRPRPEDREVLWEKRHYLHHKPEALAKVILANHSWDLTASTHMHALLQSWTPMQPVQALQLLLPCFPDIEVRRVAVSWIRGVGRDELVDYLPQLVQALKHETYDTSPLASFLLQQALWSPRVAHQLFWLISQCLPGQYPQNSFETAGMDDLSLSQARYHPRLQLTLRALLATCGEALSKRFCSQQMLVKNLLDVAQSVKNTKESHRLQALGGLLESVHKSLVESSSPTCLPLSPALEVSGVQVRTSSYFPSNTLPLKINFLGTHAGIIPAIFKVGDDLQQDMLTIQIIRIMDKMWLKEGLDLKMVTFTCVPTGHKRGMIEMVQKAETLRKIQVELGLTGSFKDRPIAEWLAKHNPSALEYERAVRNFTASCAGYSVATYILGICDRHNDNIMLKTSGHLFHIDFGKFLGDAQRFGNFKRDRTPFVLTSDMAYVINGGEKPSVKFHHFVDLCCQAFNIIRKHGNLILNLFGLMASSGIPGVTMDAVSYVQRALLPDLTNPEAAANFARMIESSLKSWFTQFNFFLHNLAQLRFTGDHNDGELLSFIPKTYTMQQEGRITTVAVFGYQKRYDPEKYYLYILRVDRVNQPDPSYLFRSYKEFCELQQKLCIHFPLAKCHSLTSGLHMGRSNIKQVAEKRRVDIERFLFTLFKMADEIAHSDLVYTFFHPLLRDQQEASMANIHATKLRERKAARPPGIEAHRLKGQLKLSLHYQREALMVMVHHARELPLVAGSQEPSPYVKVYLLPDPTKQTKRKTKVVRRNCHPTFMEMLEYRMPLEVVCNRTLQATVWNHDTLQENEFLGGVSLPLENIDLTAETVEWYSLGNICR